ncbi:MAG: hypothetical protein WC518_02450 [Patescibacteria group bacterium]
MATIILVLSAIGALCSWLMEFSLPPDSRFAGNWWAENSITIVFWSNMVLSAIVIVLEYAAQKIQQRKKTRGGVWLKRRNREWDEKEAH